MDSLHALWRFGKGVFSLTPRFECTSEHKLPNLGKMEKKSLIRAEVCIARCCCHWCEPGHHARVSPCPPERAPLAWAPCQGPLHAWNIRTASEPSPVPWAMPGPFLIMEAP